MWSRPRTTASDRRKLSQWGPGFLPCSARGKDEDHCGRNEGGDRGHHDNVLAVAGGKDVGHADQDGQGRERGRADELRRASATAAGQQGEPAARSGSGTLGRMRKMTRRTFPDGSIVHEVITTPDTEMSPADLAVERAMQPAIA